jgi:Tfp pilus assembly protein PilF
MGLAYLEGNKESLAMTEFEKALKLDPHNPKVLHAVSTFYLKRNDYVKAEEYIKRALKEQPENPEFLNVLASIQAANGLIDEAIETWKKVLNNPSYPTVERIYYNIGYALYESSRYNEAKYYFYESIRVSRNFMLPYLYLFRIYQLQQNPQEAEKILRKALDANPLFLPMMFELGRFYYENNRYADAAKTFNKILELYKDSKYAEDAKIYLRKMGIY